jgi:hypothetical protein
VWNTTVIPFHHLSQQFWIFCALNRQFQLLVYACRGWWEVRYHIADYAKNFNKNCPNNRNISIFTSVSYHSVFTRPGGAGNNVKRQGQPFKMALHFSGRQYLLKLYCMDTRLLVAIMGRQLRH